MMWFVMVPPWLFFLAMAVTAVVGIWELMEDADARAEEHFRKRTPEEIFPEMFARLEKCLEPGSSPEFQHLLKRLAASRK
jgi:hypothetical protein